MQPNDEKRQAFERAKQLLDRNDDAVLMYAGLELRRCLEAVVYEKLWAYRNRIPADAARKWQPPQAFRALLAMEPDAAQSSVLRFAPEATLGGDVSGPFTTLGVDLRPSPGWLTKTYNKLGGVLHAQWPYARRNRENDPKKLRDYLNTVATELEPYVTRSFTSTLANIVQFECSVCRQPIIANSSGVEKAGEVTCLDVDCGSRYFCEKDGDEFTFRLDASPATCPDCQNIIQVPTQKLAVGYKFQCDKCDGLFEVGAQTWEFQKCKAD